jgi:hypothetical protein
MASIFDSIQQQVTTTAVQQVSQRLGIDPAVAQQTINAAIPVVTAALAAHARSGGAQTIHREATKQASTPQPTSPLPEVLGSEHANVEQRVSDATGLSRDDAGKIVGAVAPAILRGIGQHVQQQGIDPSQLGSVLSAAAERTRPSSQEGGTGSEATL